MSRYFGSTTKIACKRMLAVCALALILPASIALAASMAQAADLPKGSVELTIVGDISRSNRSEMNDKRDAFFKFHKQDFERGFAFDRAMLDGLDKVEITITPRGWETSEAVRVSGPRLADVMNAAGCPIDRSLRTLALDGFATRIEADSRRDRDWILAMSADGRGLDIGGRGPFWIVFDIPDDRSATLEESVQWPWGVFMIECEADT
ncbi:hypothetical protein [Thioalkalivibrio sp. HK1]|uniref:hypothetical protein n=1 Tax=Thioalkalivibrio sp. HK1 TaxID=1469245 RepID=UPI0012DD2CD2|nr:hypothetical protein [Thioalkalivibrio sp. HK1]